MQPTPRRSWHGLPLPLVVSLLPVCVFGTILAAEKTERFDRDPKWEGHHNRSTAFRPRSVKQDFGYSRTAHAGGKPGEIGGTITPDAEPAYYARKISPRTFQDPLTASGTFACTGREFHLLVGFFNADTLNEWRTPNTIAIRLSGRGDVFYAWLEYATGLWRAGGDSPRGFQTPDGKGRVRQKEFAGRGAIHRWSLRYDPAANKGGGVITATIDGETAVCELTGDHKTDPTSFNRFGLLNVMKSADGGGEVWLDDLTINSAREDFTTDPGWEGRGNQRSYLSTNIRPRFDFGFSQTNHAGGRSPGEIGGLIFRGDCRYPERMACYGDRLDDLTLDKPLRASGKMALRRGVTDSTVLLGFYHAVDSMTSNPSQSAGLPRSFVGLSTDGPSRDGFLISPAFRTRTDHASGSIPRGAPTIYPDGKSHDWSLAYDPEQANGKGRLTVALDGKAVSIDLPTGARNGTVLNRFGFVTTWIDGNGQSLYLDDLTYTVDQKKP